MISTGRRDLAANRWSPFVHVIDFVGFDLTGATFKAQVRDTLDDPGAALITLNNAGAGAQGISVTTTSSGGVTTSHVTVQIDEATIEGVYAPGTGKHPAGADIELFYDLHITSGGIKVRWLEGYFTIRAGATQ